LRHLQPLLEEIAEGGVAGLAPDLLAHRGHQFAHIERLGNGAVVLPQGLLGLMINVVG
jgi:hypothetical protein